MLKALQSTNGVYITRLSKLLGVTPKKVKDSIESLKAYLTDIANKNNVTLKEVIDNPEKYGVFNGNN